MKLSIFLPAVAAALAGTFMLASCSEEDLDPRSVLDDSLEEGTIDPNGYCAHFDQWLKENYSDPYNMQFIYRTQHKGTDMNYNLVPPTIEHAMELAVLTKYLWYDVYGDLVGKQFLKQYGPKILHLIGSSGINAQTGTELLGLAEGGLKVTLYKVNELDYRNPEMLNALFFHTMHHEFTHIMHQTKTYPREFNLISSAFYQPLNWEKRNAGSMASLGFTSPYGSSQQREDFAEVCAGFITFKPEAWDFLIWCSERGWYEGQEGNNISSVTYQQDTQNFCYYYYLNEKNQENDFKTYVGHFYRVRDDVYRITDLECTLNVEGQVVNAQTTGGFETYETVEQVEAFFQRLRDEGKVLYPIEDTDGQDGKANIEQKVDIARNWYRTAYNFDLDSLRARVQDRQNHINMVELMTPLIGEEEARAKYSN